MRGAVAICGLSALLFAVRAEATPPKLPTVLATERPRYAPANDPLASVEAYKRVLADAVLDPTLELFTPGSRMLRARRPLPADDMRSLGAALAAVGPLRAHVLRHRAVVFPEKSGQGVLPVLLQSIDGTWRIDQVEMEKALRLGPDGTILLRDNDTPYAYAIEGKRDDLSADLGVADLYGEDPTGAIDRLEHAKKSAGTEFRLAEILMRDGWLVDEALPHYEEAVRLAPDDWNYTSTYALRVLFLGIGERAVPALQRFGDKADGLLGRVYAQAKQTSESQYYWRRSLIEIFKQARPPSPPRVPNLKPPSQQAS